MRHPVRTPIRIIVTAGCLLAMLGGLCIILAVRNASNPTQGVGLGIATYGLGILSVYWVSSVAWRLGRAITRDVLAPALEPVPSPEEIELQLRREGHDPTLQDIAAVHQMLASQKQEAVSTAVLGIGALYLLRKR